MLVISSLLWLPRPMYSPHAAAFTSFPTPTQNSPSALVRSPSCKFPAPFPDAATIPAAPHISDILHILFLQPPNHQYI